MQSGLTYGFAGLIRDLVDGLKNELAMERVAVVVTGGYTRVLEPLMGDIATAIDENLTLKGLNMAYAMI
jgi:type III pantothenate kinase